MELDINRVITRMGNRIAELEIQKVMLETENAQLQEQLNGTVQEAGHGHSHEADAEA